MITKATAFKLACGTLTFTWQRHIVDSLSTWTSVHSYKWKVPFHLWWHVFLPTAFARSPSQPSWPPLHPWPKSNGSPVNLLTMLRQWGGTCLPAYLMQGNEWTSAVALMVKTQKYQNSAFMPHSPIIVSPFHSCQLNLTGIWILILPRNFVDHDATVLQWLNYARSTVVFWGLSFCKSVRRFTSKRHQIRLNGETLSSTIITWQFTVELTLTFWG